jgi:hypothetical protein
VLLLVALCAWVLDAFEMIFVIVPIVAPALIARLGDAQQAAVLLLLVLQLSFLIPPMGYAVLMARARSGLPAISSRRLLGALWPMLLVQVMLTAAVFAFPATVHWLDAPSLAASGQPPVADLTYSYSSGLALMPRSGGAIQAAILPGSVTRFIRLLTNAVSAGVGSHWSFFASNSACADRVAQRVGEVAGPGADFAAEAGRRQLQFKVHAGALDAHVPARHADVAVLDVFQARDFIHAVAHVEMVSFFTPPCPFGT